MRILFCAIIASFVFDIWVDATCGVKKAYDCRNTVACVVIP